MLKDTSDALKATSCFILSLNPCFVHDLFLSSYVVNDKPRTHSLFVCTRIVLGLFDEKREEQSNIIPDFFGQENSVWLRDFILTKQCYLKLTIWNNVDVGRTEDFNYIYFAEADDESDKNILFFVDDSLKKRVYPKFFARRDEMK